MKVFLLAFSLLMAVSVGAVIDTPDDNTEPETAVAKTIHQQNLSDH